VRRLLSRFIADRTAATSIEYAIIALGVGIIIIGAVTSVGTTLSDKFVSVKDAVK